MPEDDDIESWITINGTHIPIRKGQSKDEAIRDHFGKEPPDHPENVKAWFDATKRIEESKQMISKDEALAYREKGEVPEGYYVHGRQGKQDLETGHVIQMTKDWEIAKQYAGATGSEWLIKEPSKKDIFDATNPDNTLRMANKAFSEYKDGTLHPEVENFVAAAIQNANGNIKEAKQLFAKELNPENIVESAQFWDASSDASNWFYERTGKSFIKTANNGAILLDSSLTKNLRIT